MIQWEPCGDCYTSDVCNGHYAEACSLPNGDWHVDIIRTSDGRTAMHYDADTMFSVKVTVGELLKRLAPASLTQTIVNIQDRRSQS